MKTRKNIFVAVLVFAACWLALPTQGKAQETMQNSYMNVDWQFNFPLGNHFADKASGWGMNFEAGYNLCPNWGLGLFLAYGTNNEYVPRETIELSTRSTMTTDQQHSFFQLPFGATARYNIPTSNSVFAPYLAVKLGANYAKMSSYYNAFKSADNSWGFYASPEVGVNINILPQQLFGLHVAAYYSYATNKSSVLTYSIDGLNNFGLRLGVSF